jgi:hypothetical protein
MKGQSRIKDIAALLPLIGSFLLLPVVLLLFSPSSSLFGIPILLIYMFTLWLALIFASRALSERLSDEAEPTDTDPPNRLNQET